jgi:hypothetical protein
MSKAKVSKSAIIRKLYDEGRTPKEIKHYVKCSPALIGIVLRNYKKKAEKKAQFKSPRSRLVQDVFQMKKALDVVESKPTKLFVQPQYKDAAIKILADNDLVNQPPHYKTGGVETLDFIEAKDLNYRLGNVIKYVSRAGKKDGSDPVQDLEKAAFYLKREIDARKSA